ncbi:hypothetical protein [Brevibacillus daliensis]|nr:hypothetical protein [Brevibacillus daliensis]
MKKTYQQALSILAISAVTLTAVPLWTGNVAASGSQPAQATLACL